MSDLADYLIWAALQAGVKLIHVSSNIQAGYEDVKIIDDESFYGIKPEPYFTNNDIDKISSFSQASQTQKLSQDFSEKYFDRFRNIALDMYEERRDNKDVPFYNGSLARLKDAYVEQGHSPSRSNLILTLGKTSYFTSIGTNLFFDGYNYKYSSNPDEQPLPEKWRWSTKDDLEEALRESPLANNLAIHLFLYNDREIIYVRRGKVGQNTSLWNSTVNGTMEFSEDNPDIIDGKPNVGKTAERETEYELGINIDHKDIKWLGLGVTISKCEPFLIGVCKIAKTRDDIKSAIDDALEGEEIDDEQSKDFREKVIRVIGRKYYFLKEDISFGVGTLSVPHRIIIKANMKKLIRQKVIQQTEKIIFQKNQSWTGSGAASLLLCLAHLSNTKRLQKLLENIKYKISKQL